jgi:Ser/Thr protein kinase RdoA (MazF antagonist)
MADAPLEILRRFGVPGDGIRLERITQGYINDTFRVHLPGGEGYILQRVNGQVFPDPEGIMENLERVLPVLRGPGYQALCLKKTPDGARSVRDAAGSLWRAFDYLPGSGSFLRAQTLEMAREAGRIVGTFHVLVSGIDPHMLKVTLPRFHDIHWRYSQLKEALSTARPGRLAKSGALAEQAESLFESCRRLPFSKFPLRVCHNDTKLSNILFDTRTEKALCLIDLDTLMPGCLLYDFGDAARTLLQQGAEEAASPHVPPVDLGMFEAFLRGWKDSGLQMRPLEIEWLAEGAVLMPALHGIRALTDYLLGDRYYRVSYTEQNLDRARQLIGAALSTRQQLPGMQEGVRKLWP